MPRFPLFLRLGKKASYAGQTQHRLPGFERGNLEIIFRAVTGRQAGGVDEDDLFRPKGGFRAACQAQDNPPAVGMTDEDRIPHLNRRGKFFHKGRKIGGIPGPVRLLRTAESWKVRSHHPVAGG